MPGIPVRLGMWFVKLLGDEGQSVVQRYATCKNGAVVDVGI